MAGPPAHLLKLLTDLQAGVLVHSISLASRKGFAQQMPTTASALAKKNGYCPEYTFRVLRHLQSNGYFTRTEKSDEKGEAIWDNTDQSSLLPVDVFGATVQHMVDHSVPAWQKMDKILETGKDGFSQTHGMDFWQYLNQRPEELDVFNKCMTQLSAATLEPLSAIYPFADYKSIVDVGGGQGHLLACILKNHAPNTRGIIFDLEDVIEKNTIPYLKEQELTSTIETKAGSIFEPETIPEADCYMMKHILHDWSDEECIQILESLSKPMKKTPGSSLFIFEHVLPDHRNAIEGPASYIDVQMLTMLTGKERTQAEWTTLMNKGGFHIEQIADLQGHPTMKCIKATLLA